MPTLRPRKGKAEQPASALTPASTTSPTQRSTSRSKPTATTATSSSSSSSSSSSPPPESTVKKRTTRSSAPPPGNATPPPEPAAAMRSTPDEERPLLPDRTAAPPAEGSVNRSWAQRNQWIVFALASGACAAFNGVFAKLTTTELTTTLSLSIARLLGLEEFERVVEIVVRGSFFGLNLAFNGVMWTLFTTALARGDSTTQVSIMNTSTNFVLTAFLGFAIFSEALPPLWWLGAAMLVAGNVIIGRKDEGKPEVKGDTEGTNETVGAVPGYGSGESTVRSGSGRAADAASSSGEGVKDGDVPDLETRS